MYLFYLGKLSEVFSHEVFNITYYSTKNGNISHLYVIGEQEKKHFTLKFPVTSFVCLLPNKLIKC